ncbi:unnamed protein product [Moneuplotes crassus]|uniref:Uncharacterized protein n=1 Tax=Euplotes crassus TaxID=5936 RepID=A0AAD1Y8B7_EUPCR|nr:unnamed protein product [Moneuplotes crassus]
MDQVQSKPEGENTEEEIDMISFRKTNDSVEENMTDLDNGEYILIKNKLLQGSKESSIEDSKAKSHLESSYGLNPCSSIENSSKNALDSSNKFKRPSNGKMSKDKLFEYLIKKGLRTPTHPSENTDPNIETLHGEFSQNIRHNQASIETLGKKIVSSRNMQGTGKSLSYKSLHSTKPHSRNAGTTETKSYFQNAPRISSQYDSREESGSSKFDHSMSFQNITSLKNLQKMQKLEEQLEKYQEIEQRAEELASSNQKLTYLLKKTQQKVYTLEKKVKTIENKKNKAKELLTSMESEKDQIWEKWVKLNAKHKTEMSKKEKEYNLLKGKNHAHLKDLAERLEKLDRENAQIRKERDTQRMEIEELNEKIRKTHRSSSKGRRRRDSTQKRERSRSKVQRCKIKVITLLQQEVGGTDYKHTSALPLDVPGFIEEERLFVSNMEEKFQHLSKEDARLSVLATKAVSRIKTLNKICKLLKNELENSNTIAGNMEKEYKKILGKGGDSNIAHTKTHRDYTEKKYGSILNSTSISQRNQELEQSNLLMNRKYSCTQDGKLSNTLINHNDSHGMNSVMLSPEKDYNQPQAYTDRDFSQVNFSPINDDPHRSRNCNIKESQSAATLSIHQLQKSRIPETKNYDNYRNKYELSKDTIYDNRGRVSSHNKDKRDYYKDGKTKAKNHTLLRKYSENTLARGEKSKSYLNVVKMTTQSNMANFPQSARNFRGQASHMFDGSKLRACHSGLTSPQTQNYMAEVESDYSKGNSQSYSNIFKQRRNTNTAADQSSSSKRSSKLNCALPQSYFYN